MLSNEDFSVPTGTNHQNLFDKLWPVIPLTHKSVICEALRELLTNGHDAGGNRLGVHILRKEGLVVVTDNGEGFGRQQCAEFFRIADSVSKKQARLEGKKQTGQYGTGRLDTLQFGESITVFTCPKGSDGTVYTARLDRALAIRILAGTGGDVRWVATKPPKHWHLKKSETGSMLVIALPGGKSTGFPTAETLREELPRLFSRKVGRLITVDGEPLKARSVTHPIEVNFSVADMVEFIGQEAAAALGDCAVDLYIPEKWKPGVDEIRIGGLVNTICPLANFLRDMPDQGARDLIPEALTAERIVAGEISIASVGDYSAEDRKSLQPKIYAELGPHIIAFFVRVLGPLVVSEYERKELNDEAVRREQELASFRQDFGTTFGVKENVDPPVTKPKPRGKKEANSDALRVSPAFITIGRGETLEIEVSRMPQGVKAEHIRWKINFGFPSGNLSATSGSKTTFVADEDGAYEVEACSSQDPEIKATCRVNIIEAREFSISPDNVAVVQGSHQRFRARNSNLTSQKLAWATSNPRVRLLNNKGLEARVLVDRECPPGSYEIRCWDREDKSVEAKATIVVLGHAVEMIQIGGFLYEIREARFPDQRLPIVLRQEVRQALTPGGRPIGTIEVNSSHEDLERIRSRSGGSDLFKFYVAQAILLAHGTIELNKEEGEVADPEALETFVHTEMGRFIADQAKK
jgi:hypothetical protein